MITFKQYLLNEGGNIKIGEEEASPISTKNRKEAASDIHDMLSDLHDSFHRETGKNLFGENKKALTTGSAYSGSSSHLNNKDISDEELHKVKPTMGDVDTKYDKTHTSELVKHLTPGKKFGKYTVVGSKKHGNEISTLMKHENGQNHQIDFEASDYDKDEPTKFESFAHSSPWEDNKVGIKGIAHKVLLNAAGGENHKFSITHGLNPRANTKPVHGEKDPTKISETLFGKDADHSKIHSFHGVADLIKKHIPVDQHQGIIDKFVAGVTQRGPSPDASTAITLLKKTLGTK